MWSTSLVKPCFQLCCIPIIWAVKREPGSNKRLSGAPPNWTICYWLWSFDILLPRWLNYTPLLKIELSVSEELHHFHSLILNRLVDTQQLTHIKYQKTASKKPSSNSFMNSGIPWINISSNSLNVTWVTSSWLKPMIRGFFQGFSMTHSVSCWYCQLKSW